MNDPVNLFLASVNLLILMAVWHWVWRPTALDHLRQKLFSIRDDLFLDAADGKFGLGFADADYREYRGKLNQILRFSHTFRLSFLLLLRGENQQPAKGNLANGKMDSDPMLLEKRNRLSAVDQRYQSALLEYLLATTFWAWLALVLVLVFFIFRSIWRHGFRQGAAVGAEWSAFWQLIGSSIARNIRASGT